MTEQTKGPSNSTSPRQTIDLSALKVSSSGSSVSKVTWDPQTLRPDPAQQQPENKAKLTVHERLSRLEQHMELVIKKLEAN